MSFGSFFARMSTNLNQNKIRMFIYKEEHRKRKLTKLLILQRNFFLPYEQKLTGSYVGDRMNTISMGWELEKIQEDVDVASSNYKYTRT